MNTFESQVRQTSPKDLKSPKEHRKGKSGDDLRYISTPKAAAADGDYEPYSGLSPDSEMKPIACKWWGSRNEKADSAKEAEKNTRISSQDIAKVIPRRSSTDLAHPLTERRELQTLSANHRSHPNCDWQHIADLVLKGVLDLRAYLSHKFSSLNSAMDDVQRYTHMVSYQFAELAANLKPHLVILEHHDDQCVWIPKCSWRCGEAYMTMAGVMAHLIETQMLSNACILRLHKSLKMKKGQLLQQADLVRDMEQQMDLLREQIDAISVAAKKPSEELHEITSLETMVHSNDLSAGDRECFWSEYEDAALETSQEPELLPNVRNKVVGRNAVAAAAAAVGRNATAAVAAVGARAPRAIYLSMIFCLGLIMGGLFLSDLVRVVLDRVIELAEPPQFKYLCDRKKY